MDDPEKPVKRSLQFRLSVWLSGTIIGIAIIAGTFSFFSALNEANELQDNILRQTAALFDRYPDLTTSRKSLPPDSDEAREDHVFVQRLTAGPEPHGEQPRLPETLPDGVQTLTVDNDSYRIYVTTLANGQRLAVGQRTTVRDEIARDGAFRTLLPFLVLVPILVLLTGNIIRKMFRPLTTMAQRLDRNQDQNLRALNEPDLPPEIEPFVVAINRLLARVNQSVAAQRRFIADAAHELRTPLTALSLQAERLSAIPLNTAAAQRLATLRGGIRRTRKLLDQLLTFTRLQETVVAQPQRTSLSAILQATIEDMLPLAESRQIDFGMVSPADSGPFWVAAGNTDVQILLTNLVANALNYTPPHGRVDVSARRQDNGIELVITDTGPGIDPTERQRVFDPFYRILGQSSNGSGLGLAIVKSIADRIDARLLLENARSDPPYGLRVTVLLPAVRPSSPDAIPNRS